MIWLVIEIGAAVAVLSAGCALALVLFFRWIDDRRSDAGTYEPKDRRL